MYTLDKSKQVDTESVYVLTFKHSNGNLTVLGKFASHEDAIKAMYSFLEEHNFKSYYTRMSVLPDGTEWYDVGSWTEFFTISLL